MASRTLSSFGVALVLFAVCCLSWFQPPFFSVSLCSFICFVVCAIVVISKKKLVFVPLYSGVTLSCQWCCTGGSARIFFVVSLLCCFLVGVFLVLYRKADDGKPRHVKCLKKYWMRNVLQ